MNITDIKTLGIDYNIVDVLGNTLKCIKIITQDEILASSLGEYNEEFYDSFDAYITESKNRLSGFVLDPLKIYWHTCTEHSYELMDVIDFCMENDYEYAIVEIIPYESIDTML